MGSQRIGVAVMARDAAGVLANTEEAERLGISAAWLTAGGPGLDPMSLFAAAAVKTDSILMGTSIVQTWPRHPIAMAMQARTLADLAPGRFRLGVGPSHRGGIESTYGLAFNRPLGHLREYVLILKQLLQTGSVEFNGQFYQANTRMPGPVDIPVMISALQRGSFELAGAEADGAITWVCPGEYLRDVALPAMRSGADQAGRPVPPLITHAPVCVHDDRSEALSASREQLGFYPRAPFYAQMFSDAGFPEAKEGVWSDGMIDAVVLSGNETQVEERLHDLLSWGSSELLVHVVTAGDDRNASRQRTLKLVAKVAKTVSTR